MKKEIIAMMVFVIIAIFAMGAALDPDAILNAIFNSDLKAINVNLLHESYPAVDDIALSGELTVGGTTALNGGLTMDSGAFSVADTSGNVTTTGRLQVDGNAIFQNITANQNLIVKGSSSLNGGLLMDFDKFIVEDTTGNTTISGTLSVGGLSIFENISTVGYSKTAGASTMVGPLSVLGGAIINDNGTATIDFRAESDTEVNMLFLDADADTNGALYLGGSTNGIKISKGGDLLLLGTGSYERHVQIVAKADGTVANQPLQVDFFTVGGLQYATTGTKNAFCQFEMPDDWDGGDIYFEVDWFPDSGAMSGTDTIDWNIEYRSLAIGELINNGTSVTLTSPDNADYAQYQTKHTRVTLAYNNVNQPLTKQDHVYFRITRNTAVANDFAGSVTVAAYEIIYNSVGFPTNN